MPSYRIAICRHHSSEAPDRHEILEAANEQEALLAAVCRALDESIPGIDKYSLPAINNAFRSISRTRCGCR